MIYNKQGEAFEYEGEKYQIGSLVMANAQSLYDGLIGIITEIRTDEDKETENPSADIYCDFMKPHFKEEKEEFQRKYMRTEKESFDWDTINLSKVIMAPEMLEPVKSRRKLKHFIQVFILEEDWTVDGESGVATEAFFEYKDALKHLRMKMYQEKHSGCVVDWADKNLVEEYSGAYYEAYVDGHYCENHYWLNIKPCEIELTPSVVGLLNIVLENRNRYLDFADQVESWEELKDFTWQELEDFLNDPSIPQRIERKLGGYKVDEDDVYSNEVSEVAHELLAIHLAKKKGTEKGNDKKTVS